MNYFEVIKHSEGEKFPLFVGTTGDEHEAVRLAARCEHAEINAIDDNPLMSVTVYDDDLEVYSGRWWTEEMRLERQRIGSYRE